MFGKFCIFFLTPQVCIKKCAKNSVHKTRCYVLDQCNNRRQTYCWSSSVKCVDWVLRKAQRYKEHSKTTLSDTRVAEPFVLAVWHLHNKVKPPLILDNFPQNASKYLKQFSCLGRISVKPVFVTPPHLKIVPFSFTKFVLDPVTTQR